MTRDRTKTPNVEEGIPIGEWKVELRMATARVEGRGPLAVEDECTGHCCRHGVYAALPEQDRIMAYADRIQAVMDDTQTTDTRLWFEDEIEEDDDYPGGVCIGTAIYNDKCAFLDANGLCVLQKLEPDLELPEGERLKPFYCRLFPLVTLYDHVEFDDLCDGIRPCCTLASDGPTRAVDAYAYEFREILGDEGYEEFRRVAAEKEAELEARRVREAEAEATAMSNTAHRTPP
jgi:hypothetical protein